MSIFSFSRKAILIALSVFLSLPETRGAQLVLALVWLVLNVSVSRFPCTLTDCMLTLVTALVL